MITVLGIEREQLFRRGIELATALCERSGYESPRFAEAPCGGYGEYRPRSRTVVVAVARCALPVGNPGYSWSYPGYKADVTPVGVTVHETGHHIEWLAGDPGWSSAKPLLRDLRQATVGEPPVTSYEPNLSERLAEAVKLLGTNPALLAVGRPRRYGWLVKELALVPDPELLERGWRWPLRDAHPRLVVAAESWVRRGGGTP